MREPRDTCARNGREGLQTGQMGRCNRCADASGQLVSSHSASLMRSKSTFSTAVKLVNPVGNQVIAAHNYAVPADENVRTLLAGR